MSLTLDIAGEVRVAVASMVPVLQAALVEAVRTTIKDRLVTVEEAAEIASCSTGAIRKRITRGTLPVARVGRSVRIRTSDLLGEGRR